MMMKPCTVGVLAFLLLCAPSALGQPGGGTLLRYLLINSSTGISWCDSSIKITCIQVLKRTGCFSTRILMKILRCVSRATLALTEDMALENCMFHHATEILVVDNISIVSLLCRVWRVGLWRGRLTDVLLLRLEIQISVSSWLLNMHWISTSFWPPAWTSHQLSSSSILLSSQSIQELRRQSLHARVSGQQALPLWFHGTALRIWATLLRLIPVSVRTVIHPMHSVISVSVAHRWIRLLMYVMLFFLHCTWGHSSDMQPTSYCCFWRAGRALQQWGSVRDIWVPFWWYWFWSSRVAPIAYKDHMQCWSLSWCITVFCQGGSVCVLQKGLACPWSLRSCIVLIWMR